MTDAEDKCGATAAPLDVRSRSSSASTRLFHIPNASSRVLSTLAISASRSFIKSAISRSRCAMTSRNSSTLLRSSPLLLLTKAALLLVVAGPAVVMAVVVVVFRQLLLLLPLAALLWCELKIMSETRSPSPADEALVVVAVVVITSDVPSPPPSPATPLSLLNPCTRGGGWLVVIGEAKIRDGRDFLPGRCAAELIAFFGSPAVVVDEDTTEPTAVADCSCCCCCSCRCKRHWQAHCFHRK